MITAQGLVDLVKRHIPKAEISFGVNEGIMEQLRKLNLARRMDSSLAERDWGFKANYDAGETLKEYISECSSKRALYDYPIPAW